MLVAFTGPIVAWLLDIVVGAQLALWLGVAAGVVVAAANAWRGRFRVLEALVPVLVAGLALKHSAFGPIEGGWDGALVFAGLAAAGVSTVLAGRPFTEDYGRERAPASVHGTPAFQRLHRRLSLAWAAGFLALGAWPPLAAVLGLDGTPLTGVLTVAALAVGDRMSNRYAMAWMDRAAG